MNLKEEMQKLEAEKVSLNIILKKLERNFYPKQKKLKEKIVKIEEKQRDLINIKLFKEDQWQNIQ